MTSHDIISMIGGVSQRGVCHGEFKVDNFHMIILQILHKPAWNLVKLLYKYSYLILSQFQASQSDKIHDIRQFKYSNFKSFHHGRRHHHNGPLHQIKGRFKSIYFKAFPELTCFIITQNTQLCGPNNLCNSEANLCRQSFEKNRFKSAFYLM